MGFVEIFLIGVGLSMDAFAVAVCKGLKMHKINLKQTAVIALFFGGFQALMPTLGYLIGHSFNKYVEKFDHWIAFGLLLFIGGKMIIESVKNTEDENTGCNFDIKELFLLAVATSIDAFAVGVTFAFLKVNIIYAALLIGLTTFLISAFGVFIGKKFGEVWKKKAEISGGIILIIIGLKILIDGLSLF